MKFNTRPSMRPVLATACVLLACTAPAFAGDKPAYVPFKAGLAITETLGQPSGECYAQAPAGGGAANGDITGTGMSSPVGAITMSSQDCITSASPYLMPPLSFSSKQVTLQASNGDQLIAQYQGTATPQADGTLVLSGTFTFTGGTGKYAGVKGTGTVDGVEDISTAPAKGFVILNGQISSSR